MWTRQMSVMLDRKSTRLNSSHSQISYAVFCLTRPLPGSTLFPYTTLFRSAGIDLGYTVIRSPVDGMVISRNVDVGQTVAASLSAPTLFTIANDLTKMEVHTNVDEADVGNVWEGQEVTFTVDAFPARRFRGKVYQVRNAPVNVQGVVTYN